MKKILPAFLLLTFAAFSSAHSQSNALVLPLTTLVRHYQLSLTYNSTTVLVFPATVKAVDRGNRDVIAQRQPATENVLLLKAGRHNFQPTNLHVFTADGRIYAFDLVYQDSLATTHDLTGRVLPDGTQESDIHLSGQVINSLQMDSIISTIRKQTSACSNSTRGFRMRLQLNNIDMAGPYLFFRFTITNRSALDYTPDFLRLYIRDQSTAKRTSRQEQEISPAYIDTLPTVPGKASRSIILAIPRITIPEQKEFKVELYERNGGRSLNLRIKNRQLFRTREFPIPVTDNYGNR